MNSSDSPEPAMPAVNPITRRDFMKKSALTAGAITLLGQGTGFANPASSEFRMTCTYPSGQSWGQWENVLVEGTKWVIVSRISMESEAYFPANKNITDFTSTSSLPSVRMVVKLMCRKKDGGGLNHVDATSYPDLISTNEKYHVVCDVNNGNITRSEVNPVQKIDKSVPASNSWAEWTTFARSDNGSGTKEYTITAYAVIKVKAIDVTIAADTANAETISVPETELKYGNSAQDPGKINKWEGHLKDQGPGAPPPQQ